MDGTTQRRMTRRGLLLAAGAVAAGAATAAACGDDDDDSPSAEAQPSPTARVATDTPAGTSSPLPLTPACGDDDEPTVAQTEGPFFSPNSPERASLRESGIAGDPLVVSGAVLDVECQPVAGALLDFWQCDSDGVYDNESYRLRGHQFASDDGAYRLETIVPGLYPGRTRHIHVKVQAPDGPVLTTQLYFPDEPGNANDGIFDASLVMTMSSRRDGRFDFVVARG